MEKLEEEHLGLLLVHRLRHIGQHLRDRVWRWTFGLFFIPKNKAAPQKVPCKSGGCRSKVMMNLVTGVFVDGAQRIAREEKNQDCLHGCNGVF